MYKGGSTLLRQRNPEEEPFETPTSYIESPSAIGQNDSTPHKTLSRRRRKPRFSTLAGMDVEEEEETPKTKQRKHKRLPIRAIRLRPNILKCSLLIFVFLQ